MPEVIETKINVDLILEEYGRFYENSGQGMDRLRRALTVPATTLEKYATRINTKDDIYKMATDEWEDVLQPFRIQFEPKAGVKFIPNAIVLNHIKVDAQFSPMGVYHSWMAFLAGGQNKIEDWPITRYFVEVYLKKKIDNNRELKAVYKGVRDDNGTTPESCMDGIKRKLIEGANNADNPINVIHGVDPFTEENIFDEIEAYDRKIDELYDGENIIHFVAPKWVRAMKTAKRAAGYYFINSPDQINADIDFTKHVVCGVPSMKGTDDIFSEGEPALAGQPQQVRLRHPKGEPHDQGSRRLDGGCRLRLQRDGVDFRPHGGTGGLALLLRAERRGGDHHR